DPRRPRGSAVRGLPTGSAAPMNPRLIVACIALAAHATDRGPGSARLSGGEEASSENGRDARTGAAAGSGWGCSKVALPVPLSGAQASPRTPPMAEAMAGIEALRRRDEAASKAYDVRTLAELWTPDAVALPPGGPVKRGPELQADLKKLAQSAA